MPAIFHAVILTKEIPRKYATNEWEAEYAWLLISNVIRRECVCLLQNSIFK